MSWSCADRPSRASTTKITTSASATACRVCLAISLKMPLLGVGLEAAGVDDDELVLALAAVAVVAVAREAGEVGDDGVARLASAG